VVQLVGLHHLIESRPTLAMHYCVEYSTVGEERGGEGRGGEGANPPGCPVAVGLHWEEGPRMLPLGCSHVDCCVSAFHQYLASQTAPH
jgi:hypothetical protein